jgi:hypothetical protein
MLLTPADGILLIVCKPVSWTRGYATIEVWRGFVWNVQILSVAVESIHGVVIDILQMARAGYTQSCEGLTGSNRSNRQARISCLVRESILTS